MVEVSARGQALAFGHDCKKVMDAELPGRVPETCRADRRASASRNQTGIGDDSDSLSIRSDDLEGIAVRQLGSLDRRPLVIEECG